MTLPAALYLSVFDPCFIRGQKNLPLALGFVFRPQQWDHGLYPPVAPRFASHDSWLRFPRFSHPCPSRRRFHWLLERVKPGADFAGLGLRPRGLVCISSVGVDTWLASHG